MPLETGTNIADLVPTNPTGSDDIKQGDDHIRLIKQVLKTSFPNFTEALVETPAILNGIGGRVTTIEDAFLNKDGSVAMTGALNLGSNKIVGLAAPTASGDAATKGYVDGAIPPSSTYLTRTNNLSDLPNKATARDNLGLGNLTNALQLIASSNLSDLPNKATARNNLGVQDKITGTLAASGHVKIPVGGTDLVINWGNNIVGGNNSGTGFYNKPFTAITFATAGGYTLSGGGFNFAATDNVSVAPFNNSGCALYNGTSDSVRIWWIAVGY